MERPPDEPGRRSRDPHAPALTAALPGIGSPLPSLPEYRGGPFDSVAATPEAAWHSSLDAGSRPPTLPAMGDEPCRAGSSESASPAEALGGLATRLGKAPPRSKAQRAFDRLARQIETLRQQIEARRAGLDRDLAYYVDVIRPLEEAIGESRKEIVLALLPFLDRPEIGGKGARQRLRRFLRRTLDDILGQFGELGSPELEAAFRRVSGKSVEDAHRQDLQCARVQLEQFCEKLGLDVDFSDLHPGTTEEEILRKLAEIEARLGAAEAAKAGPPPGPRRKSKRTLEREERERAAEELRTRDIGRLYRQLAKLLHPDLEQDPALRREKESAMKVLTTAYKDGDLHTMLRLEVEWIVREQADASRLTDAKLAVYIAVLKEQVGELEEELHFVDDHPRYEPLRYHGSHFGRFGRFDGAGSSRCLKEILEGMRHSIHALRSNNGLEEVRILLESFADREAEEDRRRNLEILLDPDRR